MIYNELFRKPSQLSTVAAAGIALLILLTGAETFAANWAAGIKHILNPITTTRDDKGVWHIKGDAAAPIYDVYEAMGYAVATDRLWQAEKYRRMGRGTLAEIFGSDLLSSDIQVRTIGYSSQEYEDGYNSLDAEARMVVDGYVAGFNRRIAEVRLDRNLLPFEFKALGSKLGVDFVPADWTYIDVLAWATNMLRFFDGEGTGQGQLDNMALFQNLKARYPENYLLMFQDLRWTSDPDAVTYIPETTTAIGAVEKSKAALPAKNSVNPIMTPVSEKFLAAGNVDFKDIAASMRRNREEINASLKKINAYVKMGSYAWVVSGDKTASGNPILYSGPQMDHAFDFSAPSIVTEGAINAGGFNISGMTIPGMPVIVIGRTPHHAWSMQVGHAHTTDYFIGDPSQMSLHRMETIKIAGQADVTLPVYRTPHGPVVNADPVISWKYSHWGFEFQIIQAYLDLARATSMDAFGDAINRVTLSQHYCYADREGNIAYWMSGYDPIRTPGIDTRFPQMGDGTAEWPQPVAYKPLATDRNTSQGFYGGWNSRASLTYENAANTPSYYFGPFHRGHIIQEYLSENDNLTFEDVRDLARHIATTDSVRREFLASHCNSYGDGGNPWTYVKNAFTAAVLADPTPVRINALAVMDAWDGHFVAGGEAAWSYGTDRADAWILMNQWITTVLEKTFGDELGWGADDIGYNEDRILLFNVLLHALPGYPTVISTYYDWFSNRIDPAAPQTAEDIIVASLDETLATLGDAPWGVDKRGAITYTHEMLGPLHSMPTSSRSTYGHCVEMGNTGPVRIDSMLPLGESGTILMNPLTGMPEFDPHFFSMSPAYDGFEHRTFLPNP